MTHPNCINFLRFTGFFIMGTFVFLAGALVLGLGLSQFTYLGWTIAGGLLAAYFAYDLGDSFDWTRRFLARHRLRGIDPEEAQNQGIPHRGWGWAGALIGAIGGAALSMGLHKYSIFVLEGVYLASSYAIEAWRFAGETRIDVI